MKTTLNDKKKPCPRFELSLFHYKCLYHFFIVVFVVTFTSAFFFSIIYYYIFVNQYEEGNILVTINVLSPFVFLYINLLSQDHLSIFFLSSSSSLAPLPFFLYLFSFFSFFIPAQSNKGRLEAIRPPRGLGWVTFGWVSCIIVQQGSSLGSCPIFSSPKPPL